MSEKRLSIILILAAFCTGCAQKVADYEETRIPFKDMTCRSYGDISGIFFSCTENIVLRPETEEYMFTDIDKVVYRSGKFYIMDWVHRKIVVFDNAGKPVSSLMKRGRGPGEYLQISDFDVDKYGNIWILDGQRDMIQRYDTGGNAVETIELPYEASFIKALPSDSLYYIALSSWDVSKYRKETVLLVDASMDVKTSAVPRDEFADPDYLFPAQGFTATKDGVQYHMPVSDNVYQLDFSGEVERVYHFDFGSGTVPDKVKADIEKYRNEFAKYDVLVNSVYVGDEIIAGSILQGRNVRDFVIDRRTSELYMQDSAYEWLRLVGISDGYMIYRIMPGTEIQDDAMPPVIKEAAAEYEDILVVVSINKLADALQECHNCK